MSGLIRRGHRGPNVAKVQEQLNIAADITYSRHSRLATDGLFGRLTKARVEEYQELNGLQIDGLVGPNTWNALFGGRVPFPGGSGRSGGSDRANGSRWVTVVVGGAGAPIPDGASIGARLDVPRKGSLRAMLTEVMEELDEAERSLESLVIFGTRGSWLSPGTGTALGSIAAAEQPLKELRRYWGISAGIVHVVSVSGPAGFSASHLDTWAAAVPALAPPVPMPYPTVSSGPDKSALDRLSSLTGARVTCGYSPIATVSGASGISWSGPWLQAPAPGVNVVAGLPTVQHSPNAHRAGDYAASAVNCL